MTITQHAHIYSFHSSNFNFGDFFLIFLSIQPLTKRTMKTKKQQNWSVQIQAQEQRENRQVFQLLPIYGSKTMRKSGYAPSHHLRRHHVFLGRRPERRKTGPSRRLQGMGLGCGTCPILNGCRHQNVWRETGSRNDKRTHRNA